MGYEKFNKKVLSVKLEILKYFRKVASMIKAYWKIFAQVSPTIEILKIRENEVFSY